MSAFVHARSRRRCAVVATLALGVTLAVPSSAGVVQAESPYTLTFTAADLKCRSIYDGVEVAPDTAVTDGTITVQVTTRRLTVRGTLHLSSTSPQLPSTSTLHVISAQERRTLGSTMQTSPAGAHLTKKFTWVAGAATLQLDRSVPGPQLRLDWPSDGVFTNVIIVVLRTDDDGVDCSADEAVTTPEAIDAGRRTDDGPADTGTSGVYWLVAGAVGVVAATLLPLRPRRS